MRALNWLGIPTWAVIAYVVVGVGWCFFTIPDLCKGRNELSLFRFLYWVGATIGLWPLIPLTLVYDCLDNIVVWRKK